MELLIGCGNNPKKSVTIADLMPADWTHLVTLDMDPSCNPDVVHNLNVLPYPFGDSSFNEIHAYDVLEHCGTQGDFRFFFDQFSEFWRILKPGGYFCGTVPSWDGQWAWGDPGHTRVITEGTLTFLSQEIYRQEVGKNRRTDYRAFYKADFEVVAVKEEGDMMGFVLKAIK